MAESTVLFLLEGYFSSFAVDYAITKNDVFSTKKHVH